MIAASVALATVALCYVALIMWHDAKGRWIGEYTTQLKAARDFYWKARLAGNPSSTG